MKAASVFVLAILVLALQAMCWISVSSRRPVSSPQQENDDPKRLIGSSPPSCYNRCQGCNPCDAVLVPSNPEQPRGYRVMDLDYKPQHWMCKCGSSLSDPNTP